MIAQLTAFMDAGGEVLYLIALVTFIMWTLVFERLWFYKVEFMPAVRGLIESWNARSEHQSWYAKQIRRKHASEVYESLQDNLPVIRTLVALCPLMGLLGTVWGMIEVFHIMAMTGGGDAKLMAAGVSKATIPTMAGMVAALSGVFANTLLTRLSENAQLSIENQLVADH